MKKSIFSILFMTISVIFEANFMFAQEFCNASIGVNQVEVLVDNIREERLEEQIRDIARSEFNNIATKHNGLAVKISVRQRSYYKDIDSRTSIYVHYTLCDKDEKRIMENCFSTEGNGSIVSAAMQAKQMRKAAKGIKRFLKNYADGQNSRNLIAKK